MGDEENKELLTEQEPLSLKHLFEMVFKNKTLVEWYNPLTKRPSGPRFLKWLLMQDVLDMMGEPHDGNLYLALRRTTNEEAHRKNGLTDAFYDEFRKSFFVNSEQEEGVSEFEYLNKQYDHLQTKLDNGDRKTKVLHGLQVPAKKSYLVLMAQKAPWLATSGVESLKSVAVEDVCRLLTVAVIISLNRETDTAEAPSVDDLNKLCLKFLYHKQEALPDFSLKNIFDGIFGDNRRGAVPRQTPNAKPVLKYKEDLTDLDRLRIMLSGIQDGYSLIPTDESGTCASATQILENTSDEREINKLCGFFGHYSQPDNLTKLWGSLSKAIEQHMVAFEQVRINDREEDEDILRIIASVSPEESAKCLSGLVKSLKKSASKWPCETFSIFLSGHCLDEMTARGKNADCITAFVLIAVCCLKTKPGGPNDAIPKKREDFKKALIQKIKEVFFLDYQTVVHAVQASTKQAESMDLLHASQEVREAICDSVVDMVRACLKANMEMQLLQKINDKCRDWLTDDTASKINANTKIEEPGKDKPKTLGLGDPNSPKGGK